MTGLAAFLRHNSLGLLALVVALGGTAFAATQLPDDSVDSDTIVFQSVDGQDLAPRAVGSGKIADDAVRGRAVKESSLDADVLQRRVGGVCLAGESIRAIGSDGTVLCAAAPTGASGAAGGDLTGSYPDPQLAADSVTSAELDDGSINAIDVLLDALTGAQIDESTLTAGGDVTGTLANAQIKPGTVGPAELAALPAGRAVSTAPQSFPGGGAPLRVALDSPAFASGIAFDDGNDRFVVQTAGTYLITGEVLFAPGAGTVGFFLYGGGEELRGELHGQGGQLRQLRDGLAGRDPRTWRRDLPGRVQRHHDHHRPRSRLDRAEPARCVPGGGHAQHGQRAGPAGGR